MNDYVPKLSKREVHDIFVRCAQETQGLSRSKRREIIQKYLNDTDYASSSAFYENAATANRMAYA